MVYGGTGAICSGAHRTEFSREVFLLQFGGRGGRGGYQVGPSAHAEGSLQNDYVRERVSRAHVWGSDRYGPTEVSRGFRAIVGRLYLRSLQRYRRGRSSDR